MPKKKCLCNTLGVETKKQTHHFPFNFLRAHDWWFSHQQTPFPDVISVNSHVRKPPRRASYDRQSLGISWFELGFKNKTLVASYINIIPPLPNSFRLHVVLECFRHTTSLSIRFTLSIYFFSIWVLLSISNHTKPRHQKHQTFEITPMGFQVPIIMALPNDLPFEVTVCYWIAMVTDLQVVSFQQGPPIQFQTKSACAKSNGFCFFFFGGRNKCSIFFSKCFPNLFPKCSWGFKNDKHRFMKLPKLHNVFWQIASKWPPNLSPLQPIFALWISAVGHQCKDWWSIPTSETWTRHLVFCEGDWFMSGYFGHPPKKTCHVQQNRSVGYQIYIFLLGEKINEHSKLDPDHRKNGRAKQTPNKWRDHPLTGIMGGGWAQILSSVYHVWSKILHHLDVPGS